MRASSLLMLLAVAALPPPAAGSRRPNSRARARPAREGPAAPAPDGAERMLETRRLAREAAERAKAVRRSWRP